MAKGFHIEMQCEDWDMAKGLYELADLIDCSGLLDQMSDGKVEVSGGYFKAIIIRNS